MNTFRLAVPTKGFRGMKAIISDIFARAETFTIIDIEKGAAKNVKVEINTAFDLKQGAGPIVVKNLKEKGVDVIIALEIGPGAQTLLEMSGIRMIQVASGITVQKAMTEALIQLEKSILQVEA